MSYPTSTPPRAVHPVINSRHSHSHERKAGGQCCAAKVELDEKLSLESAVKMLISEFRQTNMKIDNLNGKIDEVKKELVTVSNDIQALKVECAEKFRVADAALNIVNERIDHLQEAIGCLENRNELTIRGIPITNGENLCVYFEAICKHLSVRKPTAHIRRVKTTSRAESGGLIIVEFALRNDRDDFYSAYLRKRDLKLRHVGLNSDQRIYINENLTVTARKLKVLALDLKRTGKLTSVFTRHGIVHVKKSPDDPPVAIYSQEDLTELM